MVDSVRGEGGRVDGGHPKAHLVELVQIVDEVFEVHIMVRLPASTLGFGLVAFLVPGMSMRISCGAAMRLIALGLRF